MLKIKTVLLILEKFQNDFSQYALLEETGNNILHHNRIFELDESTLYETFVDLGFLKNNICLFSKGLLDTWAATKEWIKFEKGKLSLNSICKNKEESLVPVVYTK